MNTDKAMGPSYRTCIRGDIQELKLKAAVECDQQVVTANGMAFDIKRDEDGQRNVRSSRDKTRINWNQVVVDVASPGTRRLSCRR